MIYRHAQIELLCYAYGGEYIVRTVRMRLHGYFAPEHGYKRLVLHIERRLLARFLGLHIIARLIEYFAQHGRYCHAGHGRLFELRAVYALGILAKGNFHCRGVLYYHVVNPPANELYGHCRAAYYVRAAGRGNAAGHARLYGAPELRVVRIE